MDLTPLVEAAQNSALSEWMKVRSRMRHSRVRRTQTAAAPSHRLSSARAAASSFPCASTEPRASVKLLLDTHIWLWGLLDPERLTPEVRAALESADNELWLSPISVWEALMLVERGRLAVNRPATEWVEQMLRALPRREASLTHEIALMSRQLTLAHQDPADRFLAATAAVMGLTLVTADERLLHSTDYAVLANA